MNVWGAPFRRLRMSGSFGSPAIRVKSAEKSEVYQCGKYAWAAPQDSSYDMSHQHAGQIRGRFQAEVQQGG
jgi:hypothetical protein